MNITIVMVTEGKHGAVNTAYVRLFASFTEANEYCNQKNTGKMKHWTKAEIVDAGELIELNQPE